MMTEDVQSTDNDYDIVAYTMVDSCFICVDLDSWIFDSGASNHMTNHTSGMYDLKPCHSMVQTADKKYLKVEKIGKLDIMVPDINGKNYIIKLNQVRYVPELTQNLISTNVLGKQDYGLIYDNGEMYVLNKKDQVQ